MVPKLTRDDDILLNKYLDRQDFIKVNRTVTEGESNLWGFLLNFTKDFLLLQLEEEFYLNGYAIIRKDHFDSITNNKFLRAKKKILASEGLLGENLGITYDIELTSWQAIFTSLKKLGHHIILECEDLDHPIFLIGPIKRVGTKSLSIHNFDATGLLDPGLTSVKYADITIVKFDDRYINVFRKYIKNPKPKNSKN